MIYTAPERIDFNRNKFKIFLAGTIDMGNSENWQKKLIDNTPKPEEIDFYNPRRVEWDESWEQDFESPQFFQQVTWEMDAMDKADLIIMNLLPGSKSPISLLELGMFAKSGKIMVCCPKAFYRSGNVHIVCNHYNIPCFETIEELLERVPQYHYM